MMLCILAWYNSAFQLATTVTCLEGEILRELQEQGRVFVECGNLKAEYKELKRVFNERNLMKKLNKQFELKCPDNFPNNKKDHYLHLKENPSTFENWIEKNKKKMEEIIFLDLSSCGLTEIPEGLLKACPNLKRLDLSDNIIESLNPKSFEGNRALQKISFIDMSMKLQFFKDVSVPTLTLEN